MILVYYFNKTRSYLYFKYDNFFFGGGGEKGELVNRKKK